jgi:rubrerythrin
MSRLFNQSGASVPEKQMAKEELVQAIRLNITAEHEAIHRYLAQAETTDHTLAKTVLIGLANEERVHVGELERLLELLTGQEYMSVLEGREKVDELAAELAERKEETSVASLEDAWQQAAESLDQLGI